MHGLFCKELKFVLNLPMQLSAQQKKNVLENYSDFKFEYLVTRRAWDCSNTTHLRKYLHDYDPNQWHVVYQDSWKG